MIVLQGPHEGWASRPPPNAVTVGVFDGVHLGHRAILERLGSQEMPMVVLTFDPHPAEVLSPGTDPRLITTIDERLALLEEASVGTVGVLDLALIRHFPPERFVSEVLVDRLGVGCLVVGTDFHFGKDRAGDVPFLVGSGSTHGFEVVVVDLLEQGGVVTSSRIRELIEAGDVASASALLGSRYRVSNVVVRGESRGRGLGFPTANLHPPARKVTPGRGIYAAFAEVGGERHSAAVNVGVRPTFGGGDLLIEAYLLDFEADLYGEVLTLEFVEKLRPELEFADIDSLVRRIGDDVADVRRILGSKVTG